MYLIPNHSKLEFFGLILQTLLNGTAWISECPPTVQLEDTLNFSLNGEMYHSPEQGKDCSIPETEH